MFASILSTAFGGLGLGHVVLGVLGTAFGYWLNNRATPAAPTTLSQAVAAVPSLPAAHASTLSDLAAEIENDPAVVAIVQALLTQLGGQKAAAAHAALQAVVAPAPATPAAAVPSK